MVCCEPVTYVCLQTSLIQHAYYDGGNSQRLTECRNLKLRRGNRVLTAAEESKLIETLNTRLLKFRQRLCTELRTALYPSRTQYKLQSLLQYHLSPRVWLNNCGVLATNMKRSGMIDFGYISEELRYGGHLKNPTMPPFLRWPKFL